MNRTMWLALAAAVALGTAAAVVPALSQAPGGAAAQAGPTETLLLSADGMRCGSCEGRIRAALEALPGVRAVGVDVAAKTVSVEYAAGTQNPKALAEVVTGLGFPARYLASGVGAGALGQVAAPARRGCGGNCCPPS